MWQNLENLNFEFKKYNLKPYFGTLNDLNWKSHEYKSCHLIKIYNFYFGHLFIWQFLNNSNFEFQIMTTWNEIMKH
jgi:hypothetical protein